MERTTMTVRRASGLAALLVLCVSSAGRAQAALTLEDAIARGMQESHRLAELREHSRAAEAVVDEHEAVRRPQVSILAGYTRTNHVDVFAIPSAIGPTKVIYPDIPNNYRGRLDLQWPIYAGGRDRALVRAAQAEVESSASDLEAARADLRLEITRAYWALLTAEEAQRVLDASVERVGVHLAEARTRLANGLVPPNEVLTVEAQRSHQQMLAIEAANQREQSAADLRRLIGAGPTDPIALARRIDEPAESLAPVDELIAAAKASRPERQAMTKRIDAAGERITAAAATRRPWISFAGGVDYAYPNPHIFPREGTWRESWDGSINFSWIVADGGRARAAVAEASATKSAAIERLADFDRLMELDVRQRALDVASARAAISAANDAVRSATEARRVVSERFTVGVATNSDLVEAQGALLQADLDRTRAFASLRLAEARLARAVGR
jgi:outer membrane protein TolC